MAKLIAEVGSVHDGSFGNACNLIKAIAKTGAWAVKFQHHIASEETLESAPAPSYFKKESRFDYFERTSFTSEQWSDLRHLAASCGIKFIVSPFSKKSAEFLVDLRVDFIKIASGEVTNIQLLKFLSRQDIPIMLSSGMSTIDEMDEAVSLLSKNLVTVMQCTSEYPCKHENVGLNVMKDISQRYNLPMSLSDHTTDLVASTIAAFLGAEYIERHVTFSRDMYGSDASTALTLGEIDDLVNDIKVAGVLKDYDVNKTIMSSSLSEMKSIFEKGLYYSKNLPAGHELTEEDFALKKPKSALEPKAMYGLIGRNLKTDVAYNDEILLDHLA